MNDGKTVVLKVDTAYTMEGYVRQYDQVLTQSKPRINWKEEGNELITSEVCKNAASNAQKDITWSVNGNFYWISLINSLSFFLSSKNNIFGLC